MSTDEQFTAFAQESLGYLWRTAYLLTGDAGRAEDLVQDALVRTYAAWSRVRTKDARAYARRVLINRHTDVWRRQRREVLTSEPRDAVDATAELAALTRHDLAAALGQLSERERTVVVLRYYLDLSERAVADQLGLPVGTVKSTSARALARLAASGKVSDPR